MVKPILNIMGPPNCIFPHTFHYIQTTFLCLETWPESEPAVAFQKTI